MGDTHGSIAGRVVDAAGAPVPGASVVLTESPHPVSDIAPVTGADGRFHFKKLLPGTYKVAVHHAGHTGGATATVKAGEQAEVEVHLDG
jgi:protocatechuate 3,4-dioxygenase beta subunit